MTTVFIPTDPAGVRGFRDQGSWTGVAGFAATDELRRAHDFGPGADEDADFAAQTYASVQALLDHDGPRVVVAVEVSGVQPTPLVAWGQVAVPRCDWSDVLAVFVDEAEAGPALARARTAAGSLAALPDGLAQAWELDEVSELIADHDLLWYLPSEVDHLPL